jgi:hypothetical protein
MDIFTERGIDEPVWKRRPYVRWEKGDIEAVYQADPQYRELRSHALADLRKTVNSGPGWVMTRHAMPGEPPILAELRPDAPVPQVPKNHTHGAPSTIPKGDKWYGHTHSDDKTVQAEHRAAAEVCYVHHRHQEEKKYTFPMGDGMAARVDAHPDALALFEKKPPFAFFALEGVLKADALLSVDEAAFSVPGVTLWYDAREELREFADRYLHGNIWGLFVVTDSDWDNPNVVFNGLLCMDFLKDLGLAAWACRPPIVNGDPKTGADDYIHETGSALGLEIVEPMLPDGFKERVLDVLPHWRSHAMENTLPVLRWLILHSTAYGGEVVANSTTISHQINMPRRTVSNAITRLAEAEVIVMVTPAQAKPKPKWLPNGKKGTEWETEPARYAIAEPNLRVKYRILTLETMLELAR